MKTIELDFKELYTPRQIHEYIAEKLGFPEYYGKNLDALYDCLTDISEPTAIGLFIADNFTDEELAEAFYVSCKSMEVIAGGCSFL